MTRIPPTSPGNTLKGTKRKVLFKAWYSSIGGLKERGQVMRKFKQEEGRWQRLMTRREKRTGWFSGAEGVAMDSSESRRMEDRSQWTWKSWCQSLNQKSLLRRRSKTQQDVERMLHLESKHLGVSCGLACYYLDGLEQTASSFSTFPSVKYVFKKNNL